MPEKARVADTLVVLVVTITLPVTLPAAAGANITFSVALWLGARVCPTDMPLALKPGPEMLTLAMLALAVPVLVSVAANGLAAVVVTLPKLRLTGENTSAAVPVVVGGGGAVVVTGGTVGAARTVSVAARLFARPE